MGSSSARDVCAWRLHIAALIGVVGTSLCACTPSKQIRTSVEIDATPLKVYRVLADFHCYPAWNPYHIKVTGIPAAGESLTVRVARPDGRTLDVPHVRVLRAEPGKALHWGGGIAGLFRGEHRFDLTPLAGGARTHVGHDEDFVGLFVPFADIPEDVLTSGYEQTNAALKRWIEHGASCPPLGDGYYD